ncbi:MAG: DUF2334 domain-containing protein, partial [Bdellovibrionota bacterium]
MKIAIILPVFLMLFTHTAIAAGEPCVLILNDDRGVSGRALEFSNGARIHLSNLLAHFPEFQQIVLPIGDYRPGDLQLCGHVIYLAVYPMIELPTAFVRDLSNSPDSGSFFWMGPNVDLLPARLLVSKFGLSYHGYEAAPPGARTIRYRDMAFTSDGVPTGWMRVSPVDAEILAFAELPYLARRQRAFFVADMPFSYYQANDRSQIVGDALFDFLGAAPNSGPRQALIRIEDFHPNLPSSVIHSALGLMAEAGIPYALSVIPIFRDPLLAFNGFTLTQELPMSQRADFVEAITAAATGTGASVAMHGVTHQLGDLPNGVRGVSGEDFEFWDIGTHAPVASDSALWVLERLRGGYREFERAGLQTSVWITPHYAASALDSYLFGQVFDWQIGRVTYATGCQVKQLSQLPQLYTFGIGGSASSVGQNLYLASIETECSATHFYAGQTFQYPVFGDHFGQRV